MKREEKLDLVKEYINGIKEEINELNQAVKDENKIENILKNKIL